MDDHLAELEAQMNKALKKAATDGAKEPDVVADANEALRLIARIVGQHFQVISLPDVVRAVEGLRRERDGLREKVERLLRKATMPPAIGVGRPPSQVVCSPELLRDYARALAEPGPGIAALPPRPAPERAEITEYDLLPDAD